MAIAAIRDTTEQEATEIVNPASVASADLFSASMASFGAIYKIRQGSQPSQIGNHNFTVGFSEVSLRRILNATHAR